MLHEYFGAVSHVWSFDCVDFFRAGLSSEDWEDTAATADIHHNFIFEVDCVFEDSFTVGASADFILEHVLLVN